MVGKSYDRVKKWVLILQGRVLFQGGQEFGGSLQWVTSMKTTFNCFAFILFGAIASTSHAQIASVPASACVVTHREVNERTWRRTINVSSPSGQIVPLVESYDEVGSGLCYAGPNGQWLDSQEVINILPDGSGAATNAPVKAFFPPDIYNGSIKFVTADGLELQSQPLALVYSDNANSVMVATLTNSIGELVSSNEVLYPNAFPGADLLYTFRRNGLEQDLIIRSRLPEPHRIGLNDTDAKLQLITEFSNAAQPAQCAGPENQEDGLKDTTLRFGSMKMGPGRAFLIGATNSASFNPARVYKNWVTTDGRTFLVEQVPYQRIAAQIATLSASRAVRSAAIPRHFSLSRLLPRRRLFAVTTNSIRLAQTDLRRKRGLDFDYIAVDCPETNFTFISGTTYAVSGSFSLYGTTTIQGGAVIKGGGLNIDENGSIVCQTGPYFSAWFTSPHDETVGDVVDEMQGSPSVEDVTTFLNINCTNVCLHDLRFSYCQTPVYQTASPATMDIWNCQFVQVQTAIYGYNLDLYNVLISAVSSPCPSIWYDGPSLIGEQMTIDYADGIKAGYNGASVALTNCLITDSYPPISWGASGLNVQTDCVYFVSSPSTPIYQNFDNAGEYYLTNNSQYRSIGTTNINPLLLAELKHKTTYPPTMISDSTFSTATNFNARVARDTSPPDIGYYYDALDYVLDDCTANANVTFTTGTAIGWDTGGYPCLQGSGEVIFDGTADNPCWLAPTKVVLEQNQNYDDFYYYGENVVENTNVSASFSHFSIGASNVLVPTAPLLFSATNCEFFGGVIDTGGSLPSFSQLAFFNCLLEDTELSCYASGNSYISFTNCTMLNGYFSPIEEGSNAISGVVNCAFDGTTIRNSIFTPKANYNAFLLGANEFAHNQGTNNVTVTNFDWQSSWFGSFYLPTNSPLIDQGSTNANSIGLYHSTTQTNQTIEGDSIVDIGYHYVATDQYGIPLDSNGDGIPDYLEDANGDGLVDNGETNWALAILTQPVSQIAVPGSNADFYVGADGVEPVSYQWFFDGTNIAWATNSTLTLTNVQSANEGLYFAVVSNFTGCLTSSVVALEPGGLIGWWPGEGNALDSAGPNDGKLTNGMSFTNGIIGQAFRFDGTNGYILVPDSPILKPTNLTIEAWVRFSSLKSKVYGAPADWQIIAEKPDICPPGPNWFPSYIGGYTLYKQKEKSGNDNFVFGVTASDGVTDAYATNSAVSIQTNVWYFVVAVRGSNYVQLYVNGLFSHREPADTDQGYGTAPLYFGSSGEPNHSDGRLEGSLDEVALYNRALSSNEIQETYTAELSGIRNCLAPPVIVTQPSSQLATAGTTATFLVAAAGSPPLSYQWSFDGTSIAGATNATLILPGVQSTNSGNYSVVVANNQGAVTSSNALLTVDTCFSSVDVALVIDTSCYMDVLLGDGTIKIAAAQIASTNFVQELNFTSDQAALFSFNDNVTTNQGLTDSSPDLLAALGSLTNNIFTYTVMGNALQIAQSELTGPRHTSGALPVMVLLSGTPPTDVDQVGDFADSSNLVLEAATLVKAAGTRLITITLTNADTNLMALMATSPSDAYYATNLSQLTNDINLIADSICRGTNLPPTNAPSVSIISPINQTLLAWTTNVITATNTGSVPINWVQFFDNGTNSTNSIGFAFYPSNAPLYSIHWIPTAAGTNVLTALAVNTNGLSSWSAPVTNFIRGLPAVILTSPFNGEIFQDPPTNITLYATADATSDMGASVSNVIFFVGANSIATNTTPPYTCTKTFTSGTYVLRAEVVDSLGAVGYSTNIFITVEPTNRPPSVYAGPNQTVFFAAATNGIQLNGRVSDDGLPIGDTLVITWTNLSGPTMRFGNTNAPATVAYFSTPGTNVLQLYAFDGQYSNYSDVTIIILPTNQPPAVFPGTYQTIVLPAITSLDPFPIVGTNAGIAVLPNPDSVDYFEPSNCLVVARDTDSEDETNFELLITNDTFIPYSSITGEVGDAEINLATVRNTMGGFTPGEMFCGDGTHDSVLFRVEPDGTFFGTKGPNGNAWVVLPGEKYVANVTDLCVDQTGVWGGDLIVPTVDTANTNELDVWRINSEGQATVVATSLGITASGVTTVPNDVQRYGPWAGKILVSDYYDYWVLAIDTNGFVVRYPLGLGGEDVMVIPNNENFFAADYQHGLLQEIPASEFQAMAGDILFVSGDTGDLWHVRWDGRTFVTYPIFFPYSGVAGWEGAAFAPVGLPGQSSGEFQLEGVVTDDDELITPTSNLWTEVSGPPITFVDPTLTNTFAEFATNGDYHLQLSAYDGQYTVTSNVTLHVVRNQAPSVNLGTNQVIAVTNIALVGSVTDDGWPSNELTITWSELSGPTQVDFGDPTTINVSDETNLLVTNNIIFPLAGPYVIQLSASDGQAITTTNVEIIVLGPYLTLSPQYGIPSSTNSPFIARAALVNESNAPISGAAVTFAVVSGPDQGTTETKPTDSNGVATFTNANRGIVGEDLVYASYNDPSYGNVYSSTNAKDWAYDINYGQSETNDLGQNGNPTPSHNWPDRNADYYAFNGASNSIVQLSLIQLDTPMVLFVMDPSGNVVSSAVNFSGDMCADNLTIVCQTNGVYVAGITTVQPNSELLCSGQGCRTRGYIISLLSSNSTVAPPALQIYYNGEEIPNEGSVSFPMTAISASTNISLTISNTGTAALTITNVAIFGNFACSNVIGAEIPADSATNLLTTFEASSNGPLVGGVIVYATNSAVAISSLAFLVGNTYPTSAVPSIELSSPANGSTFYFLQESDGFDYYETIPIVATAAPGGPPISSVPGSVQFGILTTNGFDASRVGGPDLIPGSANFTYTNTMTTQPFGIGDFSVSALVTDESGQSSLAPPVLIHVVRYVNPMNQGPSGLPGIGVLYDGTNVASGDTVSVSAVPDGLPQYLSLVVTNTGTYPLVITNIEWEGGFSLSNSAVSDFIPVGGTETLGINYAPPASGQLIGQLIIGNNVSVAGIYTVGLVCQSVPVGYVPPSAAPPIATNLQFTVLANSTNNVLYPLYFDGQFDTNTLTITSLDTSTTTGAAAIINNGTAISYTPEPGYRSPMVNGVAEPEDGFYYTISDAAGRTASGTISIVVYATDSPLLALGAGNYSPSAGDLDVLTATDTSGSSNIVNVAFYLDNTLIGVTNSADPNGNYDLNWTAVAFNGSSDTIQAEATDKFGQVGTSQPITVTVTPPPGGPPVAAVDGYQGSNDTIGEQSLTNGVTIRDGVFNLYGQAYHPQGDSVTWQLSIYSSDGSTLIRNLTPTNTNPVGASGSSLLATCDLSTLQNGPYQLVLDVTGNDCETSTNVKFFLESNLKIGQFSFSQQDLTIPVNGIPLTVTRTYNSINPVKGDFGYGWTYTLDNMNVSLDETRKTATDMDGNTFSERSGGSYDVTLTLPNGQVTTFAYYLSGPDSLGDYTPAWQPAPGVTAKLTLQPQDSDIQLATLLDNLTGDTIPAYWNVNPDTPWGNFDFPGFLLKTEDGTKYYIKRQDLGDHELLNGGPDGADVQAYGDCYLSQIVERNLNTITIYPNSIVYANSNNVTIKQLAITRNSDNLITSISDPNGLDSNGNPTGPPSLVYQYDNQDNLIAVAQLVNTNLPGTYVTNFFTYTNSAFPHYITGIINANDTQVAKNFYDDSGKLVAVQDANGNLTQFLNNLTNNEEVVIDRLGSTNSYVYDSRGNVIIQTNALGQVTTMGYDINNNKTSEIMYLNGAPYSTNSYFYDTNLNVMLSSRDPLGNTTTYAYDTDADLTNTMDPLGNSTTNYYDGSGNLVGTSDALGDTNLNIYNGDLLMASIDPMGTMTTNTYDLYENLNATATVGNGVLLSSNTYTYDDNGNRLTSTVWRHVDGNWEGDTTTNIYDAMNRVVETLNPDGGSNTTVYTATGQQASTTDANGNKTTYAYDDENRLILTTYADGTTTSSSYDSNGNRITSTDQEGRVTQYQYDALNRLTNTVYPDSATSATVYDTLGRVARTIDARGTITANGYDVAGRRIAATNAVGSSSCSTNFYTYDQDGNQIITTDADGHSTTNVYDALNRQIQIQYPDGSTSETVYDKDGRSVAQTNQDGVATLFDYDGSGRLISVTKAPGMSEQTFTQCLYDEAGNEIAQIDALWRTNTYAYDSMGRKVFHTLPAKSVNTGCQAEGWTYDFNGNRIVHTNFAGATVFYQYDEMNRLTNRYEGGSPSVYDAYTYTPTGQRAGMYHSGVGFGITELYDNRDRLTEKLMSWNSPQMAETLTYAYDANGNVASIDSALANGVHLAYAYDPLNRLTNVLSHGQMAAGYSYDLAGNLTGMQYGNGVTNQYRYDSLNRLTNLAWSSQNGPVASFAYQLMKGGTRTNLIESTNNLTWAAYQWSFDNLYRLTNEYISTLGGITYGYDAVGNRTNQASTISGISSDSCAFDTNDEVLTDTKGNSPAFDSDNNMTNWGNDSWSADYLDRMTHAQNASHSCNYSYDSEDNVIERQLDGSPILDVVDDGNPSGYPQVLEQFTQVGGNPALTRVYSYGLALISQQQFNTTTLLPSVLSYYGYDGHGSVRFLMNTNGGITDTYTYDAFGNVISQWYAGSSATTNDCLYCGLQFDWVSGLYNNRARRLFCPIGRFTSMDQTEGDNEDPLSLHKYLYGADNPVNIVDLSGYAGFSLADSAAIGRQVHRIIGRDFVARVPGGVSGPAVLTILRNLRIPLNNVPINRLFPDLVDVPHKEVFEIKPISVGGTAAGAIQLGGYILAFNALDPAGGWHIGNSANYAYPGIIPLASPPCMVVVAPPVFGMIYYEAFTIQQVGKAGGKTVAKSDSNDINQSLGVSTLITIL